MATTTLKRLSKALNIEIDKGSSETRELIWKSGPKDAETPVDLTGCSAKLMAKKLLEDKTVGTEVVLDMTTENGGIVLGGTNGQIQLVFSDDSSTDWTWNKAAYGLEIYFPDGRTRRLVRGLITAFDEIVR